ncbi:hypothetical protein NGM10_03485 [Halorussus salilacus]|uniref:DUF7289 family protein n=1 Tax=Halorussus salilacus TaxID=2953750 RepID=UPI00209CE9FB|nr:hypothetical protein [Halorussus salilacus]USZ68804.1 hypothetical protein NGM10_03485 [Halorussus salilacus]
MMDDRAVSETLGFVFAFALVTASVGAVYTTGIGGLQDAREDEQVTNAVRAMDVLADNVRDVTTADAPSRATELKLSGATLRYGDPVEIEVQANTTDPDDDRNATYRTTTRPLVYDAPAGEVVYANGATFRVDDGRAAMRSEPGFVVGEGEENTSVVPLVLTYPRGDSGGVGGSGTVLVVAHRQSVELDGRFDTPAESGETDARINVTVDSPRADAWGRYFEAQGMDRIDHGEGSVTYQFHTDGLVVPEAAVEFELRH